MDVALPLHLMRQRRYAEAAGLLEPLCSAAPLKSGTLPAGLSLDAATGVLFGTWALARI
jgi:Putative Ig domain